MGRRAKVCGAMVAAAALRLGGHGLAGRSDNGFASPSPAGRHTAWRAAGARSPETARAGAARGMRAADASHNARMPLALITALAAGAAGLRRSKKATWRRAMQRRATLGQGAAATSIATEEKPSAGSDEFVVAILGDLHLDPRKMEDYHSGRDHIRPILNEAKQHEVSTAVVSLGDLGESKSVRPTETQELFAGTTECHELAADFLSSFGVPYEVIGGNHDLEGIDEFKTDEANLEAFMRIHGKPTPQFCRQIADKTLLVGLGSTVFRAAKYTSHEVTIDDEQLRWFEDTVVRHPAADGWRIFVFSHAPPIGSGLRVLQENHVVNGCCWLNHSGGASTVKFIELVRQHRCIKGWFSGHFHLGQDYEDSITFPTIPRELGPYPNRGSCVFVQTSVMRKGTSRDMRQQSRVLRGNKDGFEICTVNHAEGGKLRVDACITYSDCNHEVGVYAHEHAELKENTKFIKVYSPTEGDENYQAYDDEERFTGPMSGRFVDKDTTCWWHMSCGRVLGIYDGRLIEYDPSTLAPLGLVVGGDELISKRVFIVNSGFGLEACTVVDMNNMLLEGMEGADCADEEPVEQAVLLVDSAGKVTVIQPNEDGSYWRKIVRNKMIRMKEKRRFQAGEAFSKNHFPDAEPQVVSSWGPYTSIVGTAKGTGVKGLTTQAKIKEAWDLLGGGRVAAWREMGEELQAAFDSVDTDKSGFIDAEELKHAITQLDPSCDGAWVGDMMKLADTDGDKRVSLEEFARVVLFQRIRTRSGSKNKASKQEVKA